MSIFKVDSEKFQFKDTILFLGELPQNILHGISISNEINVKLLKKKYHVQIIKERSTLETNSAFKYMQIIYLFYRLLLLFFYSFRYNFKYFYLILSLSLLGLLKTYMSIFLFKILNPCTKIVVHIHRSDFIFTGSNSKIKKFLLKKIFKSVFKVIVISKGAKEKILLNYYQSDNVLILENTVEWWDEPNLPKFTGNTINFVFISNYFKEKGIIILLDAFKNFESDVLLSCYGDIGDSSIIPYLSIRNKDNVVINGPIKGLEKYKVLKRSDALILPSFNEGAPLIILEAMMLGVPIITYDVGFIKEMLYENYPLLYTGKNTVSNLQEAIKYFLNLSQEDRICISRKLKFHFLEFYSMDKHENNLLNIFN